jgi:hypothetical protein
LNRSDDAEGTAIAEGYAMILRNTLHRWGLIAQFCSSLMA